VLESDEEPVIESSDEGVPSLLDSDDERNANQMVPVQIALPIGGVYPTVGSVVGTVLPISPTEIVDDGIAAPLPQDEGGVYEEWTHGFINNNSYPSLRSLVAMYATENNFRMYSVEYLMRAAYAGLNIGSFVSGRRAYRKFYVVTKTPSWSDREFEGIHVCTWLGLCGTLGLPASTGLQGSGFSLRNMGAAVEGNQENALRYWTLNRDVGTTAAMPTFWFGGDIGHAVDAKPAITTPSRTSFHTMDWMRATSDDSTGMGKVAIMLLCTRDLVPHLPTSEEYE
jgi:hypothetical protein